jgi:hypothetical protein
VERETGFPPEDCAELVQGTLDYARGFAAQVLGSDTVPGPALGYDPGGQPRQIRMARAPWGTVAVVLPQNAFLLLAVTCLLNALAAGNRVVLRAPTQSARSAALLGVALDEALPPAHQAAVSVVVARAREFVDALCRSPLPCLLHYMGGSRHAPICWTGVSRGQGRPRRRRRNGWVWVAEDADPMPPPTPSPAARCATTADLHVDQRGGDPPGDLPGAPRALVARWRRFGGERSYRPARASGRASTRGRRKNRCAGSESGASSAVRCAALFAAENSLFASSTAVWCRTVGNSELVRDGVLSRRCLCDAAATGTRSCLLWRRANRTALCAGVLSRGPSADAPLRGGWRAFAVRISREL